MKKCKICWEPREHSNPLISTCKKCTYKKSEANKKQTRIKPISDKRKERLKWYSELELFRDFMIKKQDENWFLTCEISWKKVYISEAKPWCFSHLLAKSQFPHLRLFFNNICFVAWIEEHQLVDKYVAWNKREIEQKILNWENINILDYKK